MKVDFLLVGHGISGALLARELMLAGASVAVVDHGKPMSCSRSAGGVINPVTGKRLVASWMIDVLLKCATEVYDAIGHELDRPVITETSIIDVHATHESRQLFQDRIAGDSPYLHALTSDPSDGFNQPFGAGRIHPALIVDMVAVLEGSKKALTDRLAYINSEFCLEHCDVHSDHVCFGGIEAAKLIFCEGAACSSNPYFHLLPWTKDKGEALELSVPGLSRDYIYKFGGLSLVPWRSDTFWLGASHDWKYEDPGPSAGFVAHAHEILDLWLKLPYKVISHFAALRPANVDRRPFVGLHPRHEAVGIFNGMGGKGCSLAPFFANNFAAFLTGSAPLTPDVDVRRYKRLLLRG